MQLGSDLFLVVVVAPLFYKHFAKNVEPNRFWSRGKLWVISSSGRESLKQKQTKKQRSMYLFSKGFLNTL